MPQQAKYKRGSVLKLRGWEQAFYSKIVFPAYFAELLAAINLDIF